MSFSTTVLAGRIFLFSVLIACACTTVPPQAAQLSEAVSERISAIQVSHERLVQAYFNQSRNRIEDFMEQRWIPEFLSNFVHQARLMELLEKPSVLPEETQERMVREISARVALNAAEMDQVLAGISSAVGDTARGQIVIDFAAAAMEQIELQRRELLDPIDAMEREMIAEIRANYAELNQMQSVVTAHLQSISKITEMQDHILERLNLLKARDQLVQNALRLNEEVIELTDSGEKAVTIVEKIKLLLNNSNDG